MSIDPLDVQICIGHDEARSNSHGAVMPALVQSSLFFQESFQSLVHGLAEEHRHHLYSRGLNPTVAVLEGKLASLERGEACKCFASGMAAISALFTGLLRQGDHVLFVNQIYGPALQLAEHLTRFGIEHDHAPSREPSELEPHIRPNTRLIYFESPGTMLFHTLDIAALVQFARSRGILTAIDNTWSTPLLQKPLTMGVDLVAHSCSKYIGGHGDVVAGALICGKTLMEKIFRNAFMLFGGILAPFDAWLLIRGLRGLPVRMARHQEDALRVARYLEGHARVKKVYHPALDERDRALAEKQQRGYSGLFSFELDSEAFDALARVIDGLKLFRIGVSWGGVESLAISPNRGDNAERLRAQGIPPGLIRLSIGLEGAEALIADLEQALASS